MLRQLQVTCWQLVRGRVMNDPIHLFSPSSTAHQAAAFSTPTCSLCCSIKLMTWRSKASPTQDCAKTCHLYTSVTKPSLDGCHLHRYFFPKFLLVKLHTSTVPNFLNLNCAMVLGDKTRVFKPTIFPFWLICGHLQSLLKMDVMMVCDSCCIQAIKGWCSLLLWNNEG